MLTIGYVDIFATKGIEYLVVLGFLAAFMLFWRWLTRGEPQATAPSTGSVRADAGWFRLPRERFFFHPGHGWVVPEGSGLVRVGVDDFAQKLLGRAEAIDLPAVGTRLKQGAVGWSLRVQSKDLPMLSPVGGEVVAVNQNVQASPELLNRDPYGVGWLFEVKPSGLRTNLHNLLNGDLAVAWMREVQQTLRRAMQTDLGPALQDGGLPVAGFARAISAEHWDTIARRFLLTDDEEDSS